MCRRPQKNVLKKCVDVLKKMPELHIRIALDNKFEYNKKQRLNFFQKC